MEPSLPSGKNCRLLRLPSTDRPCTSSIPCMPFIYKKRGGPDPAGSCIGAHKIRRALAWHRVAPPLTEHVSPTESRGCVARRRSQHYYGGYLAIWPCFRTRLETLRRRICTGEMGWDYGRCWVMSPAENSCCVSQLVCENVPIQV